MINYRVPNVTNGVISDFLKEREQEVQRMIQARQQMIIRPSEAFFIFSSPITLSKI